MRQQTHKPKMSGQLLKTPAKLTRVRPARKGRGQTRCTYLREASLLDAVQVARLRRMRQPVGRRSHRPPPGHLDRICTSIVIATVSLLVRIQSRPATTLSERKPSAAPPAVFHRNPPLWRYAVKDASSAISISHFAYLSNGKPL